MGFCVCTSGGLCADCRHVKKSSRKLFIGTNSDADFLIFQNIFGHKSKSPELPQMETTWFVVWSVWILCQVRNLPLFMILTSSLNFSNSQFLIFVKLFKTMFVYLHFVVIAAEV